MKYLNFKCNTEKNYFKVKEIKFVGHGTLSKTPGMEAKICKNVKMIFICP